MNGGFTGKILKIDLTEMTSDIVPLSRKMVTHYIGGFGIAIKCSMKSGAGTK